MGRGFGASWPRRKKDAGTLECMAADIGAEGTLAVFILRQAVEDWERAHKLERKGAPLRCELNAFFGGEWCRLLAHGLDLDPAWLLRRLRERPRDPAPRAGLYPDGFSLE